MRVKHLFLAAALLLAGCGTLPQPFHGNPGPEAARLAVPPPPVLYVPPPTGALLGDDTAPVFAQDLAAALANYDVPSVAGAPPKHNWRLRVTAALTGDEIVPAYEVLGPDGKSYGKMKTAPVPAQGWAEGGPPVLAGIAKRDAPALAQLMTRVNATIQQSNPQSLANRTPRIFVGTVAGAPGDGNTSLPADLARALPSPDLQVVTDRSKADFTVAGTVKSSPAPQGQIQVELDWVVRDTNNRIVGQVTQIHALNPGDVQPYWGDVAAAATQEAAGGIQTVVENDRLKKAKAALSAPRTD